MLINVYNTITSPGFEPKINKDSAPQAWDESLKTDEIKKQFDALGAAIKEHRRHRAKEPRDGAPPVWFGVEDHGPPFDLRLRVAFESLHVQGFLIPECRVEPKPSGRSSRRELQSQMAAEFLAGLRSKDSLGLRVGMRLRQVEQISSGGRSKEGWPAGQPWSASERQEHRIDRVNHTVARRDIHKPGNHTD